MGCAIGGACGKRMSDESVLKLVQHMEDETLRRKK